MVRWCFRGYVLIVNSADRSPAWLFCSQHHATIPASLGDRPMVRHAPLERRIKVRILVSQQSFALLIRVFDPINREECTEKRNDEVLYYPSDAPANFPKC